MKRLDLLRSPVFLLALALLVVNDWVLKPAFHNALTGKLSDFAGLAAFTLFLCSLWRERRVAIAIGVSAAFTLWKSPLAQGAIDAVNTLLPFSIGRTVDYTDLAALPVVWLCCAYAPRLPLIPMRPLYVGLVAGVSLVAFTATSAYMPPFRSERETARIAPPNYAAEVSEREAGIQRMLDDLTKSHGMHCALCEPLSMGRVYESEEKGNYGPVLTLYAFYDSARAVLLYETRWDSRRGVEQGEALRAELKAKLHAQFPFVEDRAAPDITSVEKEEIDVDRKDGSPPQDDAENAAAYRAALPIVARVAAEAGMKPDSEHSFSGGLLLGVSNERALNVTVYPLGPRVVVDCRSSSCKGRAAPLAQKIESALELQFGARRVARGWRGRTGDE